MKNPTISGFFDLLIKRLECQIVVVHFYEAHKEHLGGAIDISEINEVQAAITEISEIEMQLKLLGVTFKPDPDSILVDLKLPTSSS